jgi:hypothetical protein
MTQKKISFGSLKDIHIYEEDDYPEAIVCESPVQAPSFISESGGSGVTNTVTIISALQFSGTTLQRATRTLTFSGGILVSISAQSAWANV